MGATGVSPLAFGTAGFRAQYRDKPCHEVYPTFHRPADGGAKTMRNDRDRNNGLAPKG